MYVKMFLVFLIFQTHEYLMVFFRNNDNLKMDKIHRVVEMY